ncbi:hypothetical protein vseg_001696 [Gypsophila vaccaria]
MSKESVTRRQSHINKLPNDLISRILKCLPLRNAAKLCTISRSWLCAWKELPDLKFDAKFFAEVLKGKTPTVEEFYNYLSVILLSHVGAISGFYLYVPELTSASAPDIGPWISYLSRNGVKDITIKNAHKPPLKLPYHLFSCPTLENLKLHNCVLNLLPYFKVLRNLKSIELECVVFMGNSFTFFIASCPLLQSLTLKQCPGFERIHITAPNLNYLTLSGKFDSIYLRSLENLVSFSVTLEEMVPNYQKARSCELIAYLAHRCRIQNLRFRGFFCKFLTAGGVGGMFPTCYRYLKSLELSNIETNDLDEFLWVSGMIKSCPVLEDLQISFSSKDAAESKMAYDPQYQLHRLGEVRLTSVTGVTMELKLIEFLLRCSPVLKTMYVKRHVKITNVLESRLARELMYYPRISPKATLVYLEP